MDEKIHGDVPCSSLAVESTIRIGTAGLIWGLCIGPYESRKIGLKGVARAAFVAKSVGGFGLQCGLFAGVFSITRCGLKRYRRKDDLVNGMIAGSVVGAAVAARCRSWKQGVGMACLVSAFSAAADYFGRI
ncbi:outer envelope pore protein 16-4, chloroplastic [Malania oleifera]|uniref:outer envelope pore protein 16-4, chloroplastic n=1 Tax=Malania oleifera TaxID=397392 RepID=UPI0025AEA889|nr:outer envelope pore protein 16-4, chloroplastic [Malania oleifera]